MELGTVVAERDFELVDEAGVRRPVLLRLGLPRPADVDWVCPFEIADGQTSIAHVAYGVDGVQALLLALARADADLRFHARSAGARLEWLGRDELGLPGVRP